MSKLDKIMNRAAGFIVDKRVIFYLLFAAATLYCALSISKVQVNSDITKYLPEKTETRQGIEVMEKEFTTFASANIMVSNITFERAQALADEMSDIEGVFSVGFDNTPEHYSDAAALFSLSFQGGENDEQVIEAMTQARQIVSDYDTYISSSIGYDWNAQLAREMLYVLLVAVVVIVAVLLFTSKSFFEVIIFFIVFVVAAILNMGTNFLLGEISAITNSIAVILQLALAIDYSIIFCHRYEEDADKCETAREALVASLSKAIVEISSSSLTTISGLVALTLMQFRLGYDMGIVLSKGILCSLLTVFLLMPGVIMFFHKPLQRFRHRDLVPDITGWGRLLMHSKNVFVILFILLLPLSYYASSKCVYAFSDSMIDPVVKSEQRKTEERIEATFESTTAAALIVPAGNYEYEKAILRKASQLDGIRSATGLASTEIEDGRMLTDPYTPRNFAELTGLDIETAELLYGLYGYEHEQYQPIFGDTASYTVPLLDIFEFMFEKMDQGMITLDPEQTETLGELRKTLDFALAQLRGEQYSRMVFTAAVPVEGEASVALTDEIRRIAKEYYPEGVLVTGSITSASELSDSFSGDNLKIMILTALFVFIILLFTFRSFGAALLLVVIIQGCIWINFSFPTLEGSRVFFITYLIVSAIQMGATIDYAIVLTNRFLNLKSQMPVKEAAARAVSESFPTILTSGSILVTASFLIAYLTTDLYIGGIGLALGRGSLISIICVMTVLPQALCLFDGVIERTSFTLKSLIGGGRE